MQQTKRTKEGRPQVLRQRPRAAAGHAVLASSMIADMMAEYPRIRKSSRAYETQKVLLIACVSFLLLFACTLLDFCVFR